MSDNAPESIQIASQGEPTALHKWAPLELGFRPFFLLAIWFSVVLMFVSVCGFILDIQLPNYFDIRLWHAHEMVFGYAVAVISGFLLTSVRNWTGLATPSGMSLGLLVLLWLTPRIFSFLTVLPPTVFVLLDGLFLPVLAVVLGRLLIQAKQAHNFPIPLLLFLLALCNGAVHLEMLGFVKDVSSQAMQIAVLTIVALIVVVAGRVVPFFMQRAISLRPVTHDAIEKFALPSVLLLAVAIGFDHPWLTSGAALLAAVIHGLRLYSWFDRAILKQPMLWVLHAGYAWVVAGLLLYGVAVLVDMPAALAVHVWTLGGIGMFTVGMMARVALGHTGRNIEVLSWMPLAFTLTLLATLARVVLPMAYPSMLDVSIVLSATCWIIAFVIVGLRYTSILLRARIDGKPG